MKYLISSIAIIQICVLFFIDIRSTCISDSLLKAIQGHSLYENNFQSEAIIYPGAWADPNFSSFIFDLGFSRFVKGRYLGNFPVAFSFYSGLILKLGIGLTPFLSLGFLGLAFYHLKKAYNTSLVFSLLFFFSSIINNTFVDLNEYVLFFLFCALGFTYILKFITNQNGIMLFVGIFFLSIAAWLRLESILFIISCGLATIFVLYRNGNLNLFKNAGILLLALIPLFIFFAWNQYSYGHFLGPRYFTNYWGVTTWGERFLRILSMSLFLKDSSGIKLGLFFCSPYLLLSLIYFVQNYKTRTNVQVFCFIAFLAQFIFISATAPNDGITLTARYHSLSVIPGFFLAYDFFQGSKTKLFSIMEKLGYGLGILVGLFISFGWILFSREISNFQKMAYEQNPNAYLVKNEVLCTSLGLKHLETSIFCIRSEEQENKLLEKLSSNPQINKIAFILESNEKDISSVNEKLGNSIKSGNYHLEKVNHYKTAYSIVFTRN